MAIVIADLDGQPSPLPDERVVNVTIVARGPNYACKAVTPAGRDVGRWVSDCPLTVATTAMLWLAQYEWETRQGDGGIPIKTILDDIPSIAPREAHPQDLIDVLRASFPPKPDTSAVTGATIVLERRRPAAALPEAPAPRRLVDRAAPALPVPVAPAPATTDRFTATIGLFTDVAHSLRQRPAEVGEILRFFVRSLGADGATPPEFDALASGQVAVIVARLQGDARRMVADRSEAVEAAVVQGILVDLGVLPVPASVEDPDLGDVDRMIAEAEQAAGRPSRGSAVPAGMRRLAPGEVPAHLTPEQRAELERFSVPPDDPIYEKLAATRARAQREHDRVDRALAAKPPTPAVPGPVAALPAPAVVSDPANGAGDADVDSDAPSHDDAAPEA